ncbi:MAG TPA: PfkB family carbohydrate kinase [Candidatus Sulfotelmatobacter sp.]|nr:PfkB family carbohydrate kinase [Candidatus Sulfotelmatobacter sp.]
MRALRIDGSSPYRRLIGIGGIGAGIFFELEGNHTLGRHESRLGRLLEVRDYCKLHIVIHYVAKLLGAHPSGSPFHVVPLGKIGDDAPGGQMLKEMAEIGIDTAHVTASSGKPTLFSVCFQYPDASGGNITTSNSAAAALSDKDVDEIAELLNSDGLLTIALALPEVSLEVRHHFLKLATEAGAFRAASFALAEVAPAKASRMFQLLDLVSLNEEEAGALVDHPFSADQPEVLIQNCHEFIQTCCPYLKMIVSVGKGGAYAITNETWQHCPAPAVDVASSAGAGDSLLGGILSALAVGIPFIRGKSSNGTVDQSCIRSALEFAVLLASYKCLSPHTINQLADIDSLSDFAQRQGRSFSAEVQRFFTGSRA